MCGSSLSWTRWRRRRACHHACRRQVPVHLLLQVPVHLLLQVPVHLLSTNNKPPRLSQEAFQSLTSTTTAAGDPAHFARGLAAVYEYDHQCADGGCYRLKASMDKTLGRAISLLEKRWVTCACPWSPLVVATRRAPGAPLSRTRLGSDVCACAHAQTRAHTQDGCLCASGRRRPRRRRGSGWRARAGTAARGCRAAAAQQRVCVHAPGGPLDVYLRRLARVLARGQ